MLDLLLLIAGRFRSPIQDQVKAQPISPGDLTCPDTLSVLIMVSMVIARALTASDVSVSPVLVPASLSPLAAHAQMSPSVSTDHGGSSPRGGDRDISADHRHTIGHHSVQSQPLSREVVTLVLDERHESEQTLPQIHDDGPDISDMHHAGPGGSEGGQPGVRGLQ